MSRKEDVTQPSEETVEITPVEDTVTLTEDPSDWSTETMLQVIKGEFPDFPESKLKGVVRLYRQHESLPEAWTHAEAIVFLRTGEEPAKTSKGAWVNDVTRKDRTADEWTTSELESWALDELQAGGRTNPQGVAVELKARLSLKAEDTVEAIKKAYATLDSGKIATAGTEASEPVNVPAASTQSHQLQETKAVVAKLENVKGLTPMNVAFIDDTLNRYTEAVKPGKQISEDAGMKAQNELDTMLQYVISLDAQGILAGFERIKPVFKKQMERGGVFEASNVFRFTHLMRSDNNRSARHIALLELMRIYFAEAKEMRKQCDIHSLLQHQPVDKIDILTEYFATRA